MHPKSSTSRTLAAIALAALALTTLTGCAVIRDGVARVIGAPTSAQITESSDRLDAAEQRVDELAEQRDEAAAALATIEAQRAAAADYIGDHPPPDGRRRRPTQWSARRARTNAYGDA